MNGMLIFISIIALGIIVSGILLLKQSAKKFKLTDEQLARINERNKVLEKEESRDE